MEPSIRSRVSYPSRCTARCRRVCSASRDPTLADVGYVIVKADAGYRRSRSRANLTLGPRGLNHLGGAIAREARVSRVEGLVFEGWTACQLMSSEVSDSVKAIEIVRSSASNLAAGKRWRKEGDWYSRLFHFDLGCEGALPQLYYQWIYREEERCFC